MSAATTTNATPTTDGGADGKQKSANEAVAITEAVLGGLTGVAKVVTDAVSLDQLVKDVKEKLEIITAAIIAFIVIVLLLVIGITVSTAITAASTWKDSSHARRK